MPRIKMKAMRDFRGQEGEGRNQHVEAGTEFSVADAGRSRYLERSGLAIQVGPAPALPPAREAKVQNEAAETGPLASAGGKTGEAPIVSSSVQGLAPPKRISPPSRPLTNKTISKSSRSTKAGA